MTTLSRRGLMAGAFTTAVCGAPAYRIATFTADVTPPVGEPLLAGLYQPALQIEDPLYVKGFVLAGPDKPLAVVAVDFCEIRTTAYERWKQTIAKAIGTDPRRVLVSSLHQHDAPLADWVGQGILDEYGITGGKICTPSYHEQCIQKAAAVARDAMRAAKTVTHFGIGQAKVDRVASNRRAQLPDGKVTFHRSSTTRDPAIQNAPEDLIDPYLKTLSFWDRDQPVAALSVYSVHAQTHFGKGGVTSDFTGVARAQRQRETPGVFQMYAAGCSGDTTVGKYNDGNPKSISMLADRLRQGMADAWKATRKEPLGQVRLRTVPVPLEANNEDHFAESEQKRLLANKSEKFIRHSLSAMGLGWRRRMAEGYRVEMPVMDFGGALVALAPGETFVQYQLWAQEMRPDAFVMVIGYGECAPGYIPTRKAVADGWKEDSWSWADPLASEEIMLGALRAGLRKSI